MSLLIFAMLGGLIGWVTSRMTQCRRANLSVVIGNILTGIIGALAAGWFLVPLLAGSPKSDFALTASLVALSSVALLIVVTLLREAVVPWDARTWRGLPKPASGGESAQLASKSLTCL
jgi:uncharacterized membrane protein YeaQ/YmgE (transglycosylase-associated protein family)